MSPVVTARGLTKRYGAATVVDGIDFDVAKGEIFGLLGPNGAGKTTTILMLLGLTEVSGGEIRVLDHDPVRDPLGVKRRVGYLPDQVGFYDNLTAYDNMAYTASLIGIPAGERRRRIMESFERVHLAVRPAQVLQPDSAAGAAARRRSRGGRDGTAHGVSSKGTGVTARTASSGRAAFRTAS